MCYIPFDHFVVRTPTFSSDLLKTGLNNEFALNKFINNEIFEEAIFISSMSLYREMHKFINGDIRSGKKDDKLVQTLYKYATRISTRCTPYGLFACCSVGKIDINSNYKIEKDIYRDIKLDAIIINKISTRLQNDQLIKYNILYYPNTTIYRIGARLRYIEYQVSHGQKEFKISEVAYSPILGEILKKANFGINLSVIADFLRNKEYSEMDISNFIEDLINSQVLVSELFDLFTVEDQLKKIISLVDNIPYDNEIRKCLMNLSDQFDLINSSNVDKFLSHYKEIITSLEKQDLAVGENVFFHIDSFRKTSAFTISNKVVDQIKNAINLLLSISDYHHPPKEFSNINKFKDEFYIRYGDSNVPLLEALDVESGLGYPIGKHTNVYSPLLDNIDFPQVDNFGDTQSNHNKVHLFLLKKIIDSHLKGEEDIILTDAEVKSLFSSEIRKKDLPKTLSVLLEIIKDVKDSELTVFFKGIDVGATKYLSRFSRGNKEILDLVTHVAKKEQELNTQAKLVEVIHSPGVRVDNVLSKPHLRDYELLFLSLSDNTESKTIPISDIYICVKNDKLVLFSKKNRIEIIPCLSSAIAYDYNTLPIYHFLGDFEYYIQKPIVPFNWGSLQSQFDYLPRVMYGTNIILSPRIWNIDVNQIRPLLSIENSCDLIQKIKTWRSRMNIPKLVTISDRDNDLLIDFSNQKSIGILLTLIKNNRKIVLKEYLFDSDNLVVKDENGYSYTHEIIMPFYAKNI